MLQAEKNVSLAIPEMSNSHPTGPYVHDYVTSDNLRREGVHPRFWCF